MNLDYQNPFEKIFASGTSQIFFCDHPAYSTSIPEVLRSCGQYELLRSRQKLREFCSEKKLISPAFLASDKFERLSAWAIKINRFPMAIKSATNLADGNAAFLLKAFRELPEFFELISGHQPGSVILEEFIIPKARVEITWLDGAIRLIAQSSLEKSMLLRPAWRAFPVKLPEEITKRIAVITGNFSELLAIKGVPLRFTFAITGRGPILLALNSGFNRPEYHSGWRQSIKLPELAEVTDPSCGPSCKVFSFYGFKSGDFDAEALEKLCSNSLTRWAALENQITVMICSEKTSTLQEESRRVEAMFQHLTA